MINRQHHYAHAVLGEELRHLRWIYHWETKSTRGGHRKGHWERVAFGVVKGQGGSWRRGRRRKGQLCTNAPTASLQCPRWSSAILADWPYPHIR